MTHAKYVLLLASLAFLTVTQSFAEEYPHMTVEQAAARLERVAIPEYPYEARREHRSGSGLFLLKFRYDTGALREIHCIHTTGDANLDRVAIRAFASWKAKPRQLSGIIVPITFKF